MITVWELLTPGQQLGVFLVGPLLVCVVTACIGSAIGHVIRHHAG